MSHRSQGKIQKQPTITLPRPFPHQAKILADPSRFKLLACGRRWGKTATGLLAALRGHGSYRGQFRGAIDGATIWWVAPSYPQITSSKIWDHLKRACRDGWEDKSEQEREIILPGGGSISVRSADNPDSLRGPGLDGLIVDEAAFVSQGVWQEALRPSLADRQGWALMLTTPNGRNWFHKLFADSQAGKNGWRSWQRPSSDNPLVTDSELEAIKQEIGPRAFAQEHEAQFAEAEGALWPAEYFDESFIWADNWPSEFAAGAIGLDPSMGREARPGDPSAIVFIGLGRDGILYVDSSIRRRPPLDITNDTIAWWVDYRPNIVAVEGNGFQAVLETLFDLVCRERRMPPLPIRLYFHVGRESKENRVQRLDPYLARGLFRFRRTPDNEQLLEQLQMFPIRKYHDDGPDAMEMAVRALNEMSGKRSSETRLEQVELV